MTLAVERVGPPSARSESASVSELCLRRREALVKSELVDYENLDKAEAERLGAEYADSAIALEREACTTRIYTPRDLDAAFDLLEEFRREESLGAFTDNRDGLLIDNIKRYAQELIIKAKNR